jgi:hypothetical protein
MKKEEFYRTIYNPNEFGRQFNMGSADLYFDPHSDIIYHFSKSDNNSDFVGSFVNFLKEYRYRYNILVPWVERAKYKFDILDTPFSSSDSFVSKKILRLIKKKLNYMNVKFNVEKEYSISSIRIENLGDYAYFCMVFNEIIND